jgi:YVTN family beta-propeller protein
MNLPAGQQPMAVAVSSTNRACVVSHNSSSVTVIDGKTRTVSTIKTGAGPEAVAVNPVTNRVYTANSGGAVR